MVAIASWPTTVWVPSVYWANIVPPFPIATRTNCAAGEPSCCCADSDEGCAYCVRRGVFPLYRFHVRVMPDAPSENVASGIVIDGCVSVAVGVVIVPLESNVILPVVGVTGVDKSLAFNERE